MRGEVYGYPVEESTIRTPKEVQSLIVNSQMRPIGFVDPACVVWEYLIRNAPDNLRLDLFADHTSFYKKALDSGEESQISVALALSALQNLVYQYSLYKGKCLAHVAVYWAESSGVWSQKLGNKIRENKNKKRKKRPLTVVPLVLH